MLFSPLYVSPRLADAVSDEAWISAMLDVEAALARAEARCGVIPDTAAEAIAGCCASAQPDPETIAAEARQVGNPAEPLVRVLRQLVPGDVARFVHFGATSQDVLDTASMLIAYRALAIVEDDLAALSARLAALADEHRDTLMPGRTLLQQALPITFGLKAAEWLAGVVRGRSSLRRVRDEALGAELGGAAGTLASLGDGGVTVLRAFAAEVRLREPAVPWHAERGSIAEIGSALALISGALDKIALDIILLAQSELSEVLPGGEGRQGGSSTLPHKRNPVAAVLTRACVRLAQAQSEVLERGMAHELERAAGAWQAEWPALSGALAYTGGAAQWLRQALDGLQVQRERMRANLDATDGLIMAERVSMALAERMGRDGAHDLVRRLTRHSAEEGKSLTDMLLGDPAVRAHLSKEEIEHAMDPAGYLGSANAFVDRALAAYEASL